MSKHTPTPWAVDYLCIRAADGNIGLMNLARDTDVSVANAAHIVHCVNTHDEMLGALQVAELALSDYPVELGIVRAAIERGKA